MTVYRRNVVLFGVTDAELVYLLDLLSCGEFRRNKAIEARLYQRLGAGVKDKLEGETK